MHQLPGKDHGLLGPSSKHRGNVPVPALPTRAAYHRTRCRSTATGRKAYQLVETQLAMSVASGRERIVQRTVPILGTAKSGIDSSAPIFALVAGNRQRLARMADGVCGRVCLCVVVHQYSEVEQVTGQHQLPRKRRSAPDKVSLHVTMTYALTVRAPAPVSDGATKQRSLGSGPRSTGGKQCLRHNDYQPSTCEAWAWLTCILRLLLAFHLQRLLS
jgi:hypothetical protein